jgi:hypothetical protein
MGGRTRLTDAELAAAVGAGGGMKLTSDNCAYYTTLNDGEVVDCIGASTAHCIRCVSGAFTGGSETGSIPAVYIGTNACNSLTKRKGVCNGMGSCVNQVNSGYCDGSPEVYGPQT